MPKYYEEVKKTAKRGQTHNKYALDLQLEFLEQRYQNELSLKKENENILILDRCIYEDYHIFARTQLKMGLMNQDEFNHYIKEYKKNLKDAIEPDIFIYLKASTGNLLERIEKRGRAYEKEMDSEYLDTLSKYYDDFFLKFEKIFGKSKLIVVDTDCVGSKEVFGYTCEQLRQI